MIGLSNKTSIGSAMAVSIAVPGEEVTTFTSAFKVLVIDGVSYTGLGSLLSVSESETNIRATTQSVTVAISGIPTSNINFANESLLRGSPVKIYRVIFDPITGEVDNTVIPNPIGRFFGLVSNYTLEFSMDPKDPTRSATATLVLDCISTVEFLQNKIAGRRTTPEDMKKYFPGDLSMDRVAILARSNFNFGAPTQ